MSLPHIGLRVEDILSIIKDTGPCDEYAEDYETASIPEWKVRFLHRKADVIIFNASGNNFRSVQVN